MCVAFVKLSGTDEVIATTGRTLLARLDKLAAAVGRRVRPPTGSRGSSRTSTWTRASSTSPAGAPSSYRRRRRRNAPRAPRDRRGRDRAADPAGVHRGQRVHRRYRRGVAAHVRRDGRRGQPGGAAHRAGQPGDVLATADVLDRTRTHVRDRPRAIARQGQGTRGDGPPRRRADRPARSGRSTRSRSSDAAPSSGCCAKRSTQRGCDSCRSSRSSPTPAWASRDSCESFPDARTRLPAAACAVDPYDATDSYSIWRDLLRPLVGITPDRSREEAGAQLAPWVESVMPDLAPWLPLLALALDASVPATPETDGARSCAQPRPSACHRRDVPRARADDADADRRRGHPLARRRVAVPAAPPRRPPRRTAMARLRDGTAGGRIDPVRRQPGHAPRVAAADGRRRRDVRARSRGGTRTLTDAVEALAHRAGGNPLFLRELVFAARHGTPEARYPSRSRRC